MHPKLGGKVTEWVSGMNGRRDSELETEKFKQLEGIKYGDTERQEGYARNTQTRNTVC